MKIRSAVTEFHADLLPLGKPRRHEKVQNLKRRATGWTVQGSNPCRGKRLYVFPNRPDCLWSPPSLIFNARVSYPGIKRPGREADHLPPSSAEIKSRCNLTSTPPMYMAWTETTVPVPCTTQIDMATRSRVLFIVPVHVCVCVCLYKSVSLAVL